jgi:hypothetical protein
VSDLKPCRALEWVDSDRIHGLHEACANCPNRKPVSLEKLVRLVDDRREHAQDGDFLDGYYTAMEHCMQIIEAYEEELNNG